MDIRRLRRIARRVARRITAGSEPILFEGSASYWDDRYRRDSDSGAGSYGRLAKFKAEVINGVISEMAAASVVEWGCGDGAQLRLLEAQSYVGIDVSPTAIDLCRHRYRRDASKSFMTLEVAREFQPEADVSLSLDVVYHLVEDNVYAEYMRCLFDSARLAVIIYSSNKQPEEGDAPHVRHRLFTEWVDREAPLWRLSSHIPNRYPFSTDDPRHTSFSDFYVFTRK